MADFDFTLDATNANSVAPQVELGADDFGAEGYESTPEAPVKEEGFDLSVGEEVAPEKKAPVQDANTAMMMKTMEALMEQNRQFQKALEDQRKTPEPVREPKVPEAPKDMFADYMISPKIIETMQKGDSQQASAALMMVLKDFASHMKKNITEESLALSREEITKATQTQREQIEQRQAQAQVEQIYYSANTDLNNPVGRQISTQVATELERDPRFVQLVGKYGFMSKEVMGIIAKNTRARMRGYITPAPKPMTTGIGMGARTKPSYLSEDDF